MVLIIRDWEVKKESQDDQAITWVSFDQPCGLMILCNIKSQILMQKSWSDYFSFALKMFLVKEDTQFGKVGVDTYGRYS